MLSKNNKILIGCLALLLVMSVGYALFSDTITINGSATAKGDFSITTACYEFANPANGILGDSNNTSDSGSISNAAISCEGNVVNASATLDYPGSMKWFGVAVTNTGTIPAKLKKVVELNNPDEMVCEVGNCSSIIYNFVKNANNTNSVVAELYPDISYVEDYQSETLGYDGSWDEAQLDAVLDPGETAYFYIEMRWDSNSTTPGDPLTSSLNAQITWEQVTE